MRLENHANEYTSTDQSSARGQINRDHYELVDGVIDGPSEGEVLVQTEAFAITAGTRAGLQGSASNAGAPKTGIVMNGTGVGHVVASKDPAFKEGDAVLGPTGWQQYSVHKGTTLSVIDPQDDPIHYLGPLGVNGLTAYFGLFDVGQPSAGETVMVSARQDRLVIWLGKWPVSTAVRSLVWPGMTQKIKR